MVNTFYATKVIELTDLENQPAVDSERVQRDCGGYCHHADLFTLTVDEALDVEIAVVSNRDNSVVLTLTFSPKGLYQNLDVFNVFYG